MTPEYIKTQLSHIRSIRASDPKEYEERLEALKQQVEAFIAEKGLSGVWADTLRRELD